MKFNPIKWHDTEDGCDGFTPIFDFTVDISSALHVSTGGEWEFIGQGHSIAHCKEVAHNYYEFRLKECIGED
jgi:hypothetical protein